MARKPEGSTGTSFSKIFSGDARDSASEVLANFGAMAVQPLLAVLSDPNPDVRYSAIRALGKIRATEAAPRIVELFQTERDARLRGCMVVALAQIGGPAVHQPILESFGNERDERVRCLIVSAVGLLCDSKGLPVLQAALKDSNPRVRANAVEALARLKGVNPGELVRRLLQDPNNRVRANACKVLWYSDPALVLRSLEEMIDSEDEMVRASAAYAMGEIADSRVLPQLIGRLKMEKGTRAREHLCIALGKLGDAAIRPLKEVLSMENNLNVLFALQEINRKKRQKDRGDIDHLDL